MLVRSFFASICLTAALGMSGSAFALGDAGGYDVNDDGQLDVLVLYDDAGAYGDLGGIYAEMMMNLIGHFSAVQAWAIPVSEYAAGDLLDNEVTFYIGSTYDSPLPQAFKDDFWTTDRPLIWMGYNLWQISWTSWNDFIWEYGYQHWFIAGNDGEGEATDFYRYVQYKGKELPKFAWWNEDASSFVNDPFNSVPLIDDPSLVTTHATIVHSGTGDAVPYVWSSSNLTVWADIPFTYIHERDRYLAFTDLLHDHLGIDHAQTHKALMRLEDVHPNVNPTDIRSVTNVMKQGVMRPWTIAVIPFFRDPLGYYNEGVPEEFTMNTSRARPWRRQINRAKRKGATLELHGYTHQYSDVPNPYNGVSGDDYEFWDSDADAPVAEDSYAYIAARMDAAHTLLDRRNWVTWAWEFPHYRASVLDYLATEDWYETTYQRVVYYPYEVDFWGDVYTWNEIRNDPQTDFDWANANVVVAGDRWGGQFYPYVIERDTYGQRIIPENLGNIEPPEFALGPQYVRVVPDLLANADANLVNRCAFASFFYHPYLMQFPEIADAGGPDALRDLVQGIEAMGYEFVDGSAL
jgi:uncharacterized protein YdaL